MVKKKLQEGSNLSVESPGNLQNIVWYRIRKILKIMKSQYILTGYSKDPTSAVNLEYVNHI